MRVCCRSRWCILSAKSACWGWCTGLQSWLAVAHAKPHRCGAAACRWSCGEQPRSSECRRADATRCVDAWRDEGQAHRTHSGSPVDWIGGLPTARHSAESLPGSLSPARWHRHGHPSRLAKQLSRWTVCSWLSCWELFGRSETTSGGLSRTAPYHPCHIFTQPNKHRSNQQPTKCKYILAYFSLGRVPSLPQRGTSGDCWNRTLHRMDDPSLSPNQIQSVAVLWRE